MSNMTKNELENALSVAKDQLVSNEKEIEELNKLNETINKQLEEVQAENRLLKADVTELKRLKNILMQSCEETFKPVSSKLDKLLTMMQRQFQMKVPRIDTQPINTKSTNTIRGGLYKDANGNLKNCHGQLVDKEGKVIKK